MQRNETAAEIVNDLLKINNDRIEGYQHAINETRDMDSDLKTVFEGMKRDSIQYKNELTSLAEKLGEKPETGTRLDGKIYRAWMEIKATFSGHSRKSVLQNCEFGEDAALKAYKTALSTENLMPPEIQQAVARQQQTIKAAHDKIKKLRDSEA